jgi:hypothetical protein
MHAIARELVSLKQLHPDNFFNDSQPLSNILPKGNVHYPNVVPTKIFLVSAEPIFLHGSQHLQGVFDGLLLFFATNSVDYP